MQAYRTHKKQFRMINDIKFINKEKPLLILTLVVVCVVLRLSHGDQSAKTKMFGYKMKFGQYTTSDDVYQKTIT